MGDTLIKVILALVVVGFVAYPLLKEHLGEEDSLDLPEDVEDLYHRKESAYSALKELEFDFKTGKLSEGDFRELEARYRAEALEILSAIDAMEKGRRSSTGAATTKGAKAKKGSQTVAQLEPFECGACGRVNVEEARFCAGCGTVLEAELGDHGPVAAEEAAEALECAACGAALAPGHRFCGSCGAGVED